MVEQAKFPIMDTTKLTYVGNTYYIRIPQRLVKSGHFQIKSQEPLVIVIQDKDYITIRVLKE